MYRNPEQAGCGSSTASQTAWGLMALLAHLPSTDEAITIDVAFLLLTQTDKRIAGAPWLEQQSTGARFPKFFYLGYSLYPQYLPLMALGRYVKSQALHSTSRSAINEKDIYQWVVDGASPATSKKPLLL